eukprot:7153987-Pyramimonas_sp.AAC.1
MPLPSTTPLSRRRTNLGVHLFVYLASSSRESPIWNPLDLSGAQGPGSPVGLTVAARLGTLSVPLRRCRYRHLTSAECDVVPGPAHQQLHQQQQPRGAAGGAHAALQAAPLPQRGGPRAAGLLLQHRAHRAACHALRGGGLPVGAREAQRGGGGGGGE